MRDQDGRRKVTPLMGVLNLEGCVVAETTQGEVIAIPAEVSLCGIGFTRILYVGKDCPKAWVQSVVETRVVPAG